VVLVGLRASGRWAARATPLAARLADGAPVTRRALVVGDGSAAFALPAVRSLARAGWTVGVAQPEPGLATSSRACTRHHVVPRVEHGPQAWTSIVAQVLHEGGYDMVFPTDDIELLALSSARDALPAVVPYPPHEVVLASVDKLGLTRAAQQVGLGVPVTRSADPAQIAATTGTVMVKARLHWSPGAETEDRHLPVQFATGPAQVAAAVERVRAGGGEPVLQEVLEGSLMALTVVLDRAGRLAAASHQVTLRETSRRTSARAVTVTPDEELERRCVDLLTSLGWWGPANLQFLRGANGVPKLIDLNGRFYGSLGLAVTAGADIPAVWAQVTLQEPVGPVQRARPGVRFQAFDEDLLALRARGRFPAGAPEAALFALRATHSIWDLRDPRPALDRQRLRLARAVGRGATAAGATPAHR